LTLYTHTPGVLNKKNIIIAILLAIIIILTSGVAILRNIKKSENIKQTEKTVALADSETIQKDNWELGLVFYDSTVDNGKTALKEINWNATKKEETRIITMQINYKNTNVVTAYEPGQLQIKVDNLGKYMVNTDNYSNGYASTWPAYTMKANAISADNIKESAKQYDWSYQTSKEIQSTYDTRVRYFDEYILTNNILIEKGSNTEGTIQISYVIKGSEVFQTESATIKATLNNEINSDLITFSFSSPKAQYNNAKATVEKALKSAEGLPENAENYIWVKYNINMNKSYSSLHVRMVKKHLFSVELLPNCIALDYEMKPIEIDAEGKCITDKYYKSPTNTYYYNETYLYIGYPKEDYAGTKISQNFNIYGDYCDNAAFKNSKENIELVKNFNIENIILDDFDFKYEGNLYGITMSSRTTGRESYNTITKGQTRSEFLTYFDVRTTGKSYNLQVYNDIFGITDELGNFSKLSDEEYRISEICVNSLTNSNQVISADMNCEVELYVRNRGEKEFVKYTNWNNSTTRRDICFESDKNIVGFYILYKNLKESSMIQSPSNITTYCNISRPENVKEEGTIYAISALEYYEKQEDDSYIIINEAELENYEGIIGKEIADYDLETYGHYLQRAKAEINYRKQDIFYSWFYYDEKATNASIKENVVGEKVELNERWSTVFLDDDTTYLEYIYGFKMYELLPRGVEFNGTVEDIKKSISGWNGSGHKYFKKNNNEYFKNSDEFCKFLGDHLELTIIQNWKNTGRTKLELIFDFREEPIYVLDYLKNIYIATGFDFSIPVSISYDSLETYGSLYTARMFYQNIYEKDDVTLQYSNVSIDNGELDKEFVDIDEDGDIEEKFSRGVQTYTINHVTASHQDIKVIAETDRTNPTDNTAKASHESEYRYKLRARSGINSMTNLVIYDSIEEYAKDKDGNTIKAYGNKEHWKGSFEGIDTSYAESQGYTVKTYYSENELVEELGKDTSWKEYTEAVDKTLVKSLAFEFLDSEGNKAILPSSSYIYVIIKMRAPAETNITSGNQEAFAYNGCWSEWTAIDEKGNEIDFISGINSNIVQISLKDTFNLKVNKVWEDSTNSLGVRPDNIEIKLLQNDIEYQTATISSENNWEYTFENVPISDNTNEKYKYSVIDNVNLYELTKVETTEDEREFTLTNTLKADELYTSVNGTKIWNDDNNEKGKRPEKIKINLLRDEIVFASQEVTAENNWQYNFENVPIWKNNTEKYVYTVIEENPSEKYEAIIENLNEKNGLKIKFSNNSKTESTSYDYVYIYYNQDEKIYRYGPFGGDTIADQEVIVPTKDFYLYWHTDNSNSNYYGFSIDNIEHIKTTESANMIVTLPDYEIEELTGNIYPESEHTYQDNVNKLWHYTAEEVSNGITINITNTYKKIPATLTVHHYKEGTTEKLSEDKITNVLLWDEYETTEATDIPEEYELASVEGEPKGEITKENQEVTYYYKLKDASVLVHHYIEETTTPVPLINGENAEDIKINGKVTSEYATEALTNIPEYYELVSTPENATGTMTLEQIEVTYYYRLKSYQYIVNYLEKDTNQVLKQQKQVEDVIYGTVVDSNTEKVNIEGYDFDSFDKNSLTINVTGNTINIYYTKRNDLSYTVNYLEKDTNKVLNTAKVVNNQTYQNQITEQAIDIEGYVKQEPTEQTITIAVESNVINFYYTKRNDLSYTVNYLEKDTNKVLNTEKIVNNQTYQATVTEQAIDIEGYVKQEPTEQTITIAVENNVINFYYTKRNDLSYTVKYLESDSTLDNTDDNKVLHEERVVTNQEFNKLINSEDEVISIDGYNYAYCIPDQINLGINNDENVIAIFYTKVTGLRYEVNYLEKDTNEIIAPKYTCGDMTFGDTVTSSDEVIDIDGYNYDSADKELLTITTGNNVINIYYTKRNDLSYTVNYLEKDTNKVLNIAKIVTNQTYQATVTEQAINIEGYVKQEPTEQTITISVENNTINFYYTKRNDLSYTVNYLEKDTENVLKVAKNVNEQTYQSIVTEQAVDIEGYVKQEPTEQTITIAIENNVINFYYTKRNDLSYTVNYLEKDTNKVLHEQKVVNKQIYQNNITENAIDIIGYNKEIPAEQTIIIDLNDNTIDFYYTKRNDLSYTVNYLEKDTEKVLHEQKIVNGQTYKSNITEQAINIEGYIKQEPTEQTITIEVDDNIINFYYTKRNDLSYKVNYLEKNTNKILHEQKTVNNIEFESVINTNDEVITIDGYNYDSADKENLTIAVKDNVINIYYTKVNGLSYKVNYLEKNTNKMLSPTKVVGNQVFENVITSSNEVIEIDGYNYDSLDKDTLTITTGENVINIYYTKRNDLSYKVNYLEKDTNKILSTQKVVNDMTFEDIINSSDEIITIDGYDYDSVDKNSLTITTGENVINIYYTKRRDLSYKVNYLEKDTNKVLNTQKVVDSVTFEDVINTEDEVIEIDGYNYDSVDKDELVIQTGENLINIYYTKRNDLSYKVNYLEKDTNKVLSTQKVVDNVTFEDVITSSDEVIEIDGYNYDSVDKAELVITTRENVINIYYTKRTDLHYTVNYLEKGTNKVLNSPKVKNGITLEDVITSSSEVIGIDGYNYDSVDKDELVITTSENVINIYYTKHTDLSYTVNYLEKDTNKVLKDQKVVDNVTFEDVIVAEDEVVDIYGYNFDSANVDELVIATKDNVINLYYTKKDATVVVHHYAEGTTTKVANDVTVTGKVGDDYETETSSEVPSKYELAQSPANATGTMTEDTVEVIYYYRLKSTKVIVHHYEEGTTNKLSEDVEIEGLIDSTYTTTSADDIPIKYALVEIPTNATGIMTEEVIEVTYYYAVKDAELNIYYLEKDTDIELAKPEKQTGKVGEMYRTDAKEIEGYTLVGNSGNTTGQLEVEPLTVIYYYLQNTRATVQYIDITTGEILDERTDEGLVGDEFVTETKTFDDYILVQEPAQKTVNMTKDEIVLKYYYLHISGGVIEQHIDVISGDVLYNGTHEGNEGDEYNIPSKDFTGYDLVEDRLPANSEGTMTVNPITVTYYYIHRAKVTTQYIDKTTGEKITPDVVETGHEDDLYTTENKVFEGYKLIQVPENSNGNMTKEDIIVKYYYVPESAGVVERHLDVLTDEPLVEERNYYGYAEDNYETEAKQIPGYDLVKERYPENATGKMTKEEIVVTYYYARRVQVQVKYVDKITGQEIADTEVIDGHKGDNYTTEEKAISGYDLIEVPTNQKGIMFDDVTEVIYYYIKPAKVITNYYDIDTKETIAAEEVIDGHEGDEYETVQKEIKYYNLVEVPENKAGNMTVEDIAVNYYYKKKDFNLKVEKQVKEIAYNGQVLSINGNIGKVELDKNKIASTEMVVTYEIKVTNTAELRGGAELIENIPNGMTMKEEDNKDWVIHEDTAILSVEDLEPGQERSYNVVMRWTPSENNLGMKENIAEIVKVDNEAGFEEITIDDNKGKADLVISIKTGAEDDNTIVKLAILAIFIVLGITVTCIILKEKNRK